MPRFKYATLSPGGTIVLFSIITVCCNAASTIADTIESVLSQDYPHIEYIVVDGASTDGTKEVVKRYGDKISEFVSEPDNGLYDAMNKGVRLACGDVIGFLHADDIIAGPGSISRIANSFEQFNVDAVYGDLVYFSKQHSDKIIRYWKSGDFQPAKLKFGWMPPHPALYVKKSVYERAGLPNGEYFDVSFKIASDYDFMVRILQKFKITVAYLPVVLVKMSTGGTSNRSVRTLIQKSIEDLRSMRRNNIGGFGALLSKNIRKLPQFFGANVFSLQRPQRRTGSVRYNGSSH